VLLLWLCPVRDDEPDRPEWLRVSIGGAILSEWRTTSWSATRSAQCTFAFTLCDGETVPPPVGAGNFMGVASLELTDPAKRATRGSPDHGEQRRDRQGRHHVGGRQRRRSDAGSRAIAAPSSWRDACHQTSVEANDD
jgi:hypothetical protein